MAHATGRTISGFLLALTVVAVGWPAFVEPALAKTPGKTYCINGVCHRVKTISEMQWLVGYEEEVVASYYDDCKVDKNNPCTALSSGEDFRPDLADNAASPIYPNGTILELINPTTNKQLLVRINNSGPYKKGRMLDVSRAAAEALGFIRYGTAKLKLIVISGPLS